LLGYPVPSPTPTSGPPSCRGPTSGAPTCSRPTSGAPSCNLSFAQLQEADLSFANLQEANLQGADLTFAQLQGARLFSANLQGAILFEVKTVTASQIKRATSWRLAFYSDDFLAELNLPADHNETVKKKLAEIEKEKTIMP
jgi:hypothetical protein